MRCIVFLGLLVGTAEAVSRRHLRVAGQSSGQSQAHAIEYLQHNTSVKNVAGVVADMNQSEETYGFYFPVFSSITPVLEVMKEVRRFYPTEPIYLLQDGGSADFSRICKTQKYRCIFERVPPENSRWNPHSWFKRMLKAANVMKTDYIIYLEPDVVVRHRHKGRPPHDAGGVYDNYNPGLHGETIAYLEKHGRERNPCFKMQWMHFGLTGGSYFRTKALIDAFDPAHIARIDWQNMWRKETEKIFSSDLSMHLALSFRGWDVYPWDEAAQYFGHRGLPSDPKERAAFAKKYPAYNPEAAFEHDHKEFYTQKADPEDMDLMQQFPYVKEVTCHGCVWYSGPNLNVLTKIPTQPPLSSDDARCRYDPLFHQRPPPCSHVQFATASDDWQILETTSAPQTEAPMPPPIRTTLAPSLAVSEDAGTYHVPLGLPILDGVRPGWLVKEDGLVVDGRSTSGGGGMLILQAVLRDAGGEWGREEPKRPRWLRAALATNRNHAKRHGHAMVLRWKPSEPQLTPWQRRDCGKKNISDQKCEVNNERENFNWEKHMLIAEYLASPEQFSHILLLDADAALVQPSHDTLREMASNLEEQGKDVLLTDEDWDKYGKGRINGGLIFAKNTNFTRSMFKGTFAAHVRGGDQGSVLWDIGVKTQCTSNDQICLHDLWHDRGNEEFRRHALLSSGKRYNRCACVLSFCGPDGASDNQMKAKGMKDPDLEIMHFMGSTKGNAAKELCDGDEDLTGTGADGFGCAP